MPGTEIKRRVRKLLFARSPKVFIVALFYVAVMTLLTELEYRLPGTNGAIEHALDQIGAGQFPSIGLVFENFRMTGAALAVLIMIIIPIIQVGYMGYCLRVSRGRDGDYRDLFEGFAYFPKVILLTIAMNVFIFLWSLLFIFPGIMAGYRYSQAYYILLENPEKGVLQCLRESKRMMAGKKLDLFVLDLSFIGWSFLHVILMRYIPFPLPIVLLWLYPYQGIARAGFYNQLVKYVPSLPETESD